MIMKRDCDRSVRVDKDEKYAYMTTIVVKTLTFIAFFALMTDLNFLKFLEKTCICTYPLHPSFTSIVCIRRLRLSLSSILSLALLCTDDFLGVVKTGLCKTRWEVILVMLCILCITAGGSWCCILYLLCVQIGGVFLAL